MGTTQYAGNPGGVPASIPIPDATIAPSPAAIMAPVQAAFDGVVSVKQQLMRATLQNYLPIIPYANVTNGLSAESTLKFLVTAYNPILYRWYALMRGGTSGKLIIGESVDQGRTLGTFSYVDSPNTIFTNFVGAAANTAGVTVVANTDSGGSLVITGYYVFNGLRQIYSTSVASVTATHGILRYDPTSGLLFAIYANQGGSSWSAGQAYLINANSPGVTPTLTSVTLPSTLQSGTGQLDFGSSQGYLFATNGTSLALVMTKGGTAGSDTPLLFKMVWGGSAYAFTQVTPTFFSGQILAGAAYAGGLFYILANNGASSTFYSSPDGSTWTALANVQGIWSGLTAVQNVMVTAMPDPFFGVQNSYRLATTVDGLNFQPSNANMGAASYTAPVIVNGDSPIPQSMGQVTAINFPNFIASHSNF